MEDNGENPCRTMVKIHAGLMRSEVKVGLEGKMRILARAEDFRKSLFVS